LAAVLVAPAHAGFDRADFAEQRAITGVAGPGLHRLEIDPLLYRHARTAGLADLRVVGPSGEVPYLVRPIPPAAPVEPRPSVLVDPVVLRGGGARAVLDLGQPGLEHSRLVLDIDGRDFLRRTRVERSDDERRWDLLSEGTVVFRVGSAAAAPRQSLVVEYPVSH